MREFLPFRELQDGHNDESRGERRHNHVAHPVRQVQDPVIQRHVSQIHVCTYIIEIKSFHMAETVSSARDTATRRRNGFLVAKFKIAPTNASTEAMGMIVPAK